MLTYPLFPAVTRSRRRKILTPLAAIALFASMLLLPAAAGALPPPGGGGGGSGCEGPEVIRLDATSNLGTVSIFQGGSATRQAPSGQPFT
jgi:hypothetical protein